MSWNGYNAARERAIRSWREQNRQNVRERMSKIEEQQEAAGVEKRGQLRLYEGNVFLGWLPLLVRVGNTARVSAEARSQLELGTQGIFDELLFELRSQSVKIVYDENFAKAFNFEKHYEEFVKLGGDTTEAQEKFNDDNGIELTEDELSNELIFAAATKRHEELKKSSLSKFKQRFGLPTLPGSPSIGDVDLSKFGNDAENAMRWLVETKTEARGGLATRAGNNPQLLNLLRLHASGKSVQSLTGHTLPLASAKKIFTRLHRYWTDKRSYSYEDQDFTAGTNHVRAYDTYAQVGCQYVPRTEVLRFGKMMEWDLKDAKTE